jgi:hypothetical protein
MKTNLPLATLLFFSPVVMAQEFSAQALPDDNTRHNPSKAGAYIVNGSNGQPLSGRYILSVDKAGCGLGVTIDEKGHTTASMITPGIVLTDD